MAHQSPPSSTVGWQRRTALGPRAPVMRAGGAILAIALGVLLILLSPFEGALIVGLFAITVATLVEPLVGLAVALFVGLLRAYLHTEVPQVPSQVGQVFVVLAVGAWLARGLARRELRIRPSPVLLPLVLFAGAALISLWDGVGLVPFGLPELLKWVQIILLVLFVSDHLNQRRMPWLIGVVIAVGVAQAMVGIWQFGLRGEGPDHFAILDGEFYRAYGTFEQPNPYAGYLGLVTSLAVGVLAVGIGDRLGTWWRETRAGSSRNPYAAWKETAGPAQPATLAVLLVGAAVLIMVTALGMSWSRGAWVGFAAALLVMAAALPRKAGWGLGLVALILIAVLALFAADLLPPSVAARLTGFAEYVQFRDARGAAINDANYSIIERFAHWQAAIEMLRTHLWTGVGFGAYEAAYRQYALFNWPYALGHAHNYYLTVAAESGILGVAAYAALWIVVFWQTWRVTRKSDGLARGAAIGLLGAWTHLSVHHLLDNLYVNNVHLHIGVLLGLLAFLIQRAGKGQSSP